MRLRQRLMVAAIFAGLGIPGWAARGASAPADADNDTMAMASDEQAPAAKPAEPAFEGGNREATVDDLPTGEPKEAWTIPQPRFLQAFGIKTFGWLEQGATFNSLSPSNRWNGPVACNDRSNEYELNQFWLGFERPVNTHGCGWDIGGRVDLLYGSDWRYGESIGLESRFETQDQLYGLAIPQFYGLVGYDDLTVKMGHYAACMGYEAVAAPANFFYSHSYALVYSEPVLVTGLEADYKLSDQWNLIGGFTRGWQMFEDNNTKLDFLGGIKWHNDETKTGLSFELTCGPQDTDGNNNRYTYALVFKQQLTEKLLYVAQHNLGGEEAANPYTGGYAQWYGLDQYLIYTINDHWSLGSRVEWFRDQDGARVCGIGNLNQGWMGKGGFCGTFTEATFGANWKPNANVLVRPEVRWDCYDGSRNIDGELPFGDGTRSSQFLFATDVIVTF